MREIIRWDTLTESWVDCTQNNISLLQPFESDAWIMVFRGEDRTQHFTDEREAIAYMVALIFEREKTSARARNRND